MVNIKSVDVKQKKSISSLIIIYTKRLRDLG